MLLLNFVVAKPAGDFWHTRGALPVEPLNDVVACLAGWQQPTLMLPGNHDQVRGGKCDLGFPSGQAQPWQARGCTAIRLRRHRRLSHLPQLLPAAAHALVLLWTPLSWAQCMQVSLGGHVHALTPLAAANPAVHAFDGALTKPRPAQAVEAVWRLCNGCFSLFRL